MIDHDKKDFADMMNTVMDLYNKPHLDKNTLRIWFAKLNSYSFEIVCKAFDTYIEASNKFPTPYDILILCRSRSIPFTHQLPKPKVDLQHTKEILDQIKKKYGWDKIA